MQVWRMFHAIDLALFEINMGWRIHLIYMECLYISFSSHWFRYKHAYDASSDLKEALAQREQYNKQRLCPVPIGVRGTYRSCSHLVVLKIKVSLSCVPLFVTPWTVTSQAPLSMGFPRSRNTGVGSQYLLKGIFLTQGLNLGLLNCRQILYHLSHQGSQC